MDRSIKLNRGREIELKKERDMTIGYLILLYTQ